MKSVSPILLILAVPIVLFVILLILGAAVLTSPFICIGFIFFLRAKNQRMKISTDYKLKARQARPLGPQRP